MPRAKVLFAVLVLCACTIGTCTAGKGATKVASKALDILKEKIIPKDEDHPYQKAADVVSSAITKSAEKAEKLASDYMSAVDKDPGALITKEAMKKIISGSSFLPQKAGTRTVSLQSNQGFNGFTSYQPSGWKITETMSGPTDKKEKEETKEPVYTYPMGLGPVLLNQCTEKSYDKTSPCYNSKLFNLQITICLNQIDAANYIGVGFNGRGYYNAQSRRASLVQRTCANRATFMGSDIPDTMNIFGIFETFAETKSFQSADEYMRYIRQKAGLSNQKNLFASEASKYGKANSAGIDLGGVGAIAGALIGAAAGGPAGSVMGAGLGSAIGGTMNAGSGSGKGGSKSTDESESRSSAAFEASSNAFQSASNNFFAIMYVNVILYEISLDEVKPTDLSLALLKDYMSLPVSYFSVGADVKYQNFLLRWGTHFIRSGKFGGQLKITKRARSDKSQSAQQFASTAETEFQSMFATLQSRYSQKESGMSFLFFNTKSKSASQDSGMKAQSDYSSSMKEKSSQSQAFHQSEFTQTTVEAQGGTPEIAEALVDFYTPAFKQVYHDWLTSIKDYAKPFEFQLKAINELFDMNMDDLFPSGNVDFGCIKGGGGKVEILVEPETNRRYYIETQTTLANSTKIEVQKKRYCKYSSLDDFKVDLVRRKISLERAIGVYMAEGPFPTSTFELKGGEPGCEEATLGALKASTTGHSEVLKYADMKKAPFLLAFDLPQPIPGLIPMQSKFRIIYRSGMWFATEPTETTMHLYDGCEIPESNEPKICFRNIVMTYYEQSGFLRVDAKDFQTTKARIPSLPDWLAGSIVARVQQLKISSKAENDVFEGRGVVPCNVKWLNSHRLDPQKKENCIHFTAATSGDIYVIFAAIPRDHTTWYYLQINPEGVSFYQAMVLKRRDTQKGMGILGDSNLFQSFFVCVVQKDDSVTMQYGKADPVSEVGTVYSGYSFVPDSQYSRLSFYTFGSGRKSVSLMDIRLTRMLPKVECLSKNYINVNGKCLLACHAECDQCEAARDSKACRRCKHVRVETGSGETKVTECLAQCPAGMTIGSKTSGLCQSCAAGTFKSEAGNNACGDCPAGTFSDAGAVKCTQCKAGTFAGSQGQPECKSCPLGTYSSEGAVQCDKCPRGTFSASVGQSVCTPCAFGSYAGIAGLVECTPCPKGFFADRKGQVTCSKCPAGTSSAEGSMTCNNSCKRGEYSARKGDPCRPCPPGSYGESAGSSSCSKCGKGSFQPRSGQTSCVPAPSGHYVPSEGATLATKCPVGTYSPSAGCVSCQPCPAGSYAAYSGTSECTKCPRGFFQSYSGQANCQKPRTNYYVDQIGATRENPCPIGQTTGNRQTLDGCEKCPPGHQGQGWGNGCTACSTGTYNPEAGGFCRKCARGYYSMYRRATSCTPAPMGTYVSEEGKWLYTFCQPGFYSDSQAQTSCKPCPAGRVSTAAGSKECTHCPVGSYAPQSGASSCIRCPSGYTSNKSTTACIKDCPRHLTIAYSLDRRSCHKFGECFFPGEDFVSTTEHHAHPSYYQCQAWDVTSCSPYTNGRSCHIPSSVVKEARVTGNTCRYFKKDTSTSGPWCYTTGSERWKYCDQIPKCGERVKECYMRGTTDYVSGIAVTKSGKPCQSWETRTCLPGTQDRTCHVPSDTVKRANKIGNTCRIIPGDPEQIPWCYTTTNVRWEHCNIPQC